VKLETPRIKNNNALIPENGTERKPLLEMTPNFNNEIIKHTELSPEKSSIP
jgi:hypothetical protein